MNILSTPIVVIMCGVFLLVANTFTTTVQCFPNTDITDVDCSAETVPPGDDPQAELDFVLGELVEYTSQELDYTYDAGTVHFVGDAKCERHLAPGECTDCVAEAADFLEKNCKYCVRGDVVMVDCRVKYVGTF